MATKMAVEVALTLAIHHMVREYGPEKRSGQKIDRLQNVAAHQKRAIFLSLSPKRRVKSHERPVAIGAIPSS
jgi:hypothetical protein